MNLRTTIHKIKSIEHLEIELPVQRGLYAITGQNGSGKSTLVTCASTVFFNISIKDYLGYTADDSYISFELDDARRSWTKNQNGKWVKRSDGRMNIKGFYEGSIIYGTRFRNTSYHILKKLDRIEDKRLKPADEFIRHNLGRILHNNSSFYERLFRVNNSDTPTDIVFSGDIFYYEKNNQRVSQFHMSTGENLLVSLLNSINLRNNDRASLAKPCILFLDEIELALHPSSLKRLIAFLREMSLQYNYAIYFSTHSIELIGAIRPENIFFLERYPDGSLDILNPCYPAYATRILYDHSGYDYVFLVEDDLAKEIIDRLLRKHGLLSGKLVHVLPCGGYTNVIDLAEEVVNSNLVGRNCSISIVLDGDVEDAAQAYKAKKGIHNNIPLSFLPIQSLEKFLKSSLYDAVDHRFFRFLNDFMFHQKSLSEIIEDYKSHIDTSKDRGGKNLYKILEKELRSRGKSRSDLVELVIEYIDTNHQSNSKRIVAYLTTQLEA